MLIRGLAPKTLYHLLCDSPAPINPDQPLRVFYCVCDHFEPMWNGANIDVERHRVAQWRQTLPSLMEPFRDSIGRKPQHTFFFPEEQYRREHLDAIRELHDLQLGDVEVHLHHDNDTAEGLRQTLLSFTSKLHHDHGFFQPTADGKFSYGFIHGNWCLCNARPDKRYCGVDNEIEILRQTGCYADFTLPAAPDPSQTKIINSIYYANDIPGQSRSHDYGALARVGGSPPDDSLLMIQGPLMVDWSDRIAGVVPRLDYCNLQGRRAATVPRLLRWVRGSVIVQGQPNWRFVKVHTHGCEEGNAEILLGKPMRDFHQSLGQYAAETKNFEYYYVTAREMASLVKQAEAGATVPNFDTQNAITESVGLH